VAEPTTGVNGTAVDDDADLPEYADPEFGADAPSEAPPEHGALQILRNLDVDRMTPLEALSLLASLKQSVVGK